jgi:hypothetical protein
MLLSTRHSLTYLKLGERYLLALLESRLDQRQERIGSIAIGIKFAHISWCDAEGKSRLESRTRSPENNFCESTKLT